MFLFVGLAAAGAAHAAPRPPEQAACAPAYERVGSVKRAWVALARGRVTARTAPGGRVIARFGRANANDYPTLFAVRGRVVDAACRARWYRVQLPVRPNGRTGFVPASRVRLATVSTRIEVDLGKREVRLFRANRLRLRTPAAVGAPGTPTPTGRFYVTQRLVPYDANGPYGPGALGISAFSPTLKTWTQGGPIAIHGTNDPSSVGRPVSNGCLRVPNPMLRRLFDATPAGTPVVIHR
ncbi:MAG: L,D-transpeptidase [Thermoleophilia bacterium]|nr:L,D-transpeptidase [Thermoleophilia bacterium]